MATGYTPGRMAGNMTGNTNMTKSTDRVFMSGLMAGSILEGGRMGGSMERGHTRSLMGPDERESGAKVRGSTGRTSKNNIAKKKRFSKLTSSSALQPP
jgi:hypothetical protein